MAVESLRMCSGVIKIQIMMHFFGKRRAADKAPHPASPVNCHRRVILPHLLNFNPCGKTQ